MSDILPFNIGDTVYVITAPDERYYGADDRLTFPIGTKASVVGVEYDEHLSSRAYRDCWTYQVKNHEGDLAWLTDLDIGHSHPGKPKHIITFEDVRKKNHPDGTAKRRIIKLTKDQAQELYNQGLDAYPDES